MTDPMGVDEGFPDDWDPESVLIQGLLADELGLEKPYDEQEMGEAAMAIAAASLVAQGTSESLAIACVEEALRYGKIYVSLSADGHLCVVIGAIEEDA